MEDGLSLLGLHQRVSAQVSRTTRIRSKAFSLVDGPIYHPMKLGSSCSVTFTEAVLAMPGQDQRMLSRTTSHAEDGSKDGTRMEVYRRFLILGSG